MREAQSVYAAHLHLAMRQQQLCLAWERLPSQMKMLTAHKHKTGSNLCKGFIADTASYTVHALLSPGILSPSHLPTGQAGLTALLVARMSMLQCMG